MKNLHLEGSKSTLCSPHTADQVVCPAERKQKRTGLSAFDEVKRLMS